jgi:hypothetical protein
LIRTKRISTRGKEEATRYLKLLFQVGQRYSLNQHFDAIPFTKSDKEGFPSAISGFKKLLRGTPNERRAALAILHQYTLITLPPKPDISTIVDLPNIGDE